MKLWQLPRSLRVAGASSTWTYSDGGGVQHTAQLFAGVLKIDGDVAAHVEDTQDLGGGAAAQANAGQVAYAMLEKAKVDGARYGRRWVITLPNGRQVIGHFEEHPGDSPKNPGPHPGITLLEPTASPAALVGERHAWLPESGGWSHAGWYDASNVWNPINIDARPDDARYVWTKKDAPTAAPGHPRDDAEMERLGGFGYAVWLVVSFLGGGLAAYHGAKRNHGSAWQAVKWGFLGSIAPVPVVPLAFAQGFAKPREPDAPPPEPGPQPPPPFIPT